LEDHLAGERGRAGAEKAGRDGVLGKAVERGAIRPGDPGVDAVLDHSIGREAGDGDEQNQKDDPKRTSSHDENLLFPLARRKVNAAIHGTAHLADRLLLNCIQFSARSLFLFPRRFPAVSSRREGAWWPPAKF